MGFVMKVLVILAMIGFGIYWVAADDGSFVKASVLDRVYGDKAEDTRYVEGRLHVSAGGRDVDMIAFIRLRAWDDCEEASSKMMDAVTGDCPECTFEVKDCRNELSSRYARLFEKKPARLPYLSYDAADATERDIRLITWGLNQQEASLACAMMVESLQEIAKNQPVCVAPA